ncbi:16S rRNA (cytosine(967)-C(5))-methyltransferase RsmB [Pelagibaculum spongiae]|uniref:16S rRNA (cytosine(967)-C(5))-methyltransferase n=1 Tax=Pelagibaculum spongiae TaxID=2080658 RepID=A0A2V1GS08_9GAMM|nr:16S rRNA (cytosine(967)-C(5))-methyltransferase RsmB [Pelagibaculum spongiae]PVZ68179.1 16S rRNA (cytosine(967)-C(5))-methyltransferase [Pelagibaculum spongiae]
MADKKTAPELTNARAIAAQLIQQVIGNGRSLSQLLDQHTNAQDSGLIRELCYGVLRHHRYLNALVKPLISQPFKGKERIVQQLILVGVYQLEFTRVPEHAAVSATVDACHNMKKQWASKVVNGVLRSYMRQADELKKQVPKKNLSIMHSFPDWLTASLKKGWKTQLAGIMAASNLQAPMTLRVNQQHNSRDQYLAKLVEAEIPAIAHPFSPVGITLEKPVQVSVLPGFTDGHVSVQDGSAQMAAPLLAPQASMKVLDACAAPGGKTAHLLEQQPELDLIALDSDAKRLERVKDNFQRLKLNGKIVASDASDLDNWWDGQPFDRILLDAPCSGTGVIRRHPDIKWLRRAEDIQQLTEIQQLLLQKLWSCLKPGGKMLYATCSILPAENSQQIEKFLENTSDAKELPIEAAWGQSCQHGRQLLPGDQYLDGFYYALLEKAQ